jgi:DNA repair protein RadC
MEDTMRLMEMPAAERPRERMLNLGTAAVQDAELLAVVLGTGRGSGEDALGLAHRLLRENGGLAQLARADLGVLVGLDGVGPVKATRIAAAFELGRRGDGPKPPAETSPPTPCEAPQPLWRQVAEAMRGQVAIGERALLAFRVERPESPVTLALGSALGSDTRAGAVLARLLSVPGEGAWWLVGVRPGGPPQKREIEAAERILAAARLVDLPFAGVVIAGGTRAWPVAGVAESGGMGRPS